MGSGRLSTLSVSQDNMADLPGYCALTFTLMPVGSTSRRSVQVLGFASIGPLTPPCRLDPLPVRQASALPTASSRFHLAMDTLAVQLTLPLAGCVGDLHPPSECALPGAPNKCPTPQEWGIRIQLTTSNRPYGAVIRTLTPYPCSGIVVSTESVSVSITVITCESLHTTYTLPVGAAAEVARYT